MTFGKRRTCPTSETILSYIEGSLQSLLLGQKVTAHVSTCDFCGAELHLLSRHNAATKEQPAAAMGPWLPPVREHARTMSGQRAA